MVPPPCKQRTRTPHPASRGGGEIRPVGVETVGNEHQRWSRRGIGTWLSGGRHQVEDGLRLTAAEQLHHHVCGRLTETSPPPQNLWVIEPMGGRSSCLSFF